MQKITPFLWFDDQAEEAANFYVSLFKNSKINEVSRYEGEKAEEVSGQPQGSVMVVSFELEGQEFRALNGGPHFTFTEAVSFVVNCETQEEVDHYWDNLSEGGSKGQCGWLKDKYGVSWQIVPNRMGELMSQGSVKAKAVMTAMLSMTRLDIQELEAAAEAA